MSDGFDFRDLRPGESWGGVYNAKTDSWEVSHTGGRPDLGPAWAMGYGIESYDAERDLAHAWLLLYTRGGPLRLDYHVMGSARTHEQMWPQVAEDAGFRLMPGPPLLTGDGGAATLDDLVRELNDALLDE